MAPPVKKDKGQSFCELYLARPLEDYEAYQARRKLKLIASFNAFRFRFFKNQIDSAKEEYPAASSEHDLLDFSGLPLKTPKFLMKFYRKKGISLVFHVWDDDILRAIIFFQMRRPLVQSRKYARTFFAETFKLRGDVSSIWVKFFPPISPQPEIEIIDLEKAWFEPEGNR